MKILVKNSNNREIEYNITYLYPTGDGKPATSTVTSLEVFQEFMAECHPDINTDEFAAKFGKKLSELNKRAGCGDTSRMSCTLYCFVAVDCIMSSFTYCGIMEKWYDFHNGYDKANDGYLHTFLAHNWSFDKLASGTFKVSYWYNRNDTTSPKYKIHQFKDKIIFELPNGTVHSIIVSNDHYVWYAGVKKSEK